MTETVRIIAGLVSTHNVTLWKENGETIVIPQGDLRVHPVLDAITIPLATQDFVDIDATLLEQPEQSNSFKEFEKQSGIVKFWKVAKSKLASLFGSEPDTSPVEPMEIGHIPSNKVEKSQAAVAEIMANAVSVTSPEFNMDNVQKQRDMVDENGKTPSKDHTPEDEANSSHTIVAEINGKLIPGMEKIHNQFARAFASANPIGIENFLERLSAVIDQRQHSVNDLLKFLERADLPIADDGSIIIYKVLNKCGDGYVDCHTGMVTQKVGSYVCMDFSLVDHNRRVECSNGLHVARRGYVRGFGGDVCTISKLAPEDVIAVPLYDANKMRVCGYHILHELSAEQYGQLNQNKPITNTPEGQKLMGEIMAGRHIGKLEEVRITGSNGTGLVITSLVQPVSTPEPVVEPAEVKPVDALEIAGDGPAQTAPPVDVKAVHESIKELKPQSKREQAQELLNQFKATKDKAEQKKAAEALLSLKKTSKKSWDTLGVHAIDADKIAKAVE